ncbi:MAG: acyltransferase family protein [Bacteroidia bacterium]
MARTINTENNFDAIRLIASLMVVFAHSFQITGKTYLSEPLTRFSGSMNFGNLGVAIFLFISGFLISNSLKKNPPLHVFLKRRILRMIPALAVLLIVSIFIIGPIVTTFSLKDYFSDSSTYSYFRNVIMFRPQYTLPGVFETCPEAAIVNASLWTLPYEFFFYICIFIFLFFIKEDKNILLIALLLLVLSTFIQIYFQKQLLIYQYNIPFAQLNISYSLNLFNYFIAGVIFRCLNISDKHFKFLLYISIILLAICSLKIVIVNKLIFYLLVPTATYLIAFHKKINLRKITKNHDYSYGIYLYSFLIQQTFIYFFNRPDLNPYLFFIITGIISYGAGFLSWHFVEAPFMKLKKLDHA